MNKSHWNKQELLKVSGSFWQSCVLHTAAALDVFTPLTDSPATCLQLAETMGIPEKGLCRLLNALVAMHLLDKTGDTYSPSEDGRTYFDKDSEENIAFMLRHHHQLSKSWSRLDEAIRSGKPFRSSVKQMDEKAIESFIMGMHNNATLNAPYIVPGIDLQGNRNLLDLGGGPGTYSIHFCKQNPQLNATVYDLPTSRPHAEQNIEKFGMSERITFIDGDFNTDKIPGTYDVAWLSHILHSEGEDACQRLIDKVVPALEPGGKIIIHEFILNDDESSPLKPALFSINMLLHTEAGQSYSRAALTRMLENAGIKNIKRIDIESPSGSGIIMGIK